MTVRLLDPPMHEFLPTERDLLDQVNTLRLYRDVVRGRQTALASISGVPPLPEAFNELSEEHVTEAIIKKERMLQKVRELQEANPMLGHRGVRLGITYPEIYAMQIQAILEAAAECAKNDIEVHPEIMVPQVITAQELAHVRRTVDQLTEKLEQELGERLQFKFGTMIETVRACTRAAHLADDCRLLFFWYQRSDAGGLFVLARRCREQIPAAVQRLQYSARQPVRGAGRKGRRSADQDGCCTGQGRTPGAQDRNLRRAGR